MFGHVSRERIDKLPEAVDGIVLTDSATPRTNECTPCALSKSKEQVSRRPRQHVRTAFGHVSLDLVFFTTGYNGDKYMLHASDLHSGFHFDLTVRTAEQHQIVRFCRIIYAVAQCCGKLVLAEAPGPACEGDFIPYQG